MRIIRCLANICVLLRPPSLLIFLMLMPAPLDIIQLGIKSRTTFIILKPIMVRFPNKIKLNPPPTQLRQDCVENQITLIEVKKDYSKEKNKLRLLKLINSKVFKLQFQLK